MKEKNKDIIAKKIVNNDVISKGKKHPFINLLLMLSLISSIFYFIIILFYEQNNLNFIHDLISILLIIVFNIFFILSSINYYKKRSSSLVICILLFIFYNIFGSLTVIGFVKIPVVNMVDDFTGKSLTDVVSWADKNNINLIQNYEYSDMIDEYHIINQNKKAGTNTKKIKSLTVAISEGPSPNKEVVVPNMVTWNCDKVINFINTNKLTNVKVDFIVSDKVKDTLIEQSKTGNMSRSEELNLTFSLGDDDQISDIKLSDLKGKSKFEAEFYLKQNSIDYEIKNVFSKQIKRNYVVSQSIKAGNIIKKEDKVVISISRGKKIKVPDLNKMTLTEITNWVIKNRLKLEFNEKYDEKVANKKVISANYKKGDFIEQDSLVSIVLSKGKLIMPGFNNLDDFKEWAEKFGVNYQEEHQFSDNVEIGNVISYSHKTGDVIKNNDVVIVTISDGKQIEVPDLVGMSKNDIISKLKKVNLKYSFLYKNSNSVAKDKAISQSISSGSKVSDGTTITITLSNGKKEVTKSNSSTNKSNNNTNNTNNGSNTNNNSNSNPSTPSCDKSNGSELNIQTGSSGEQTKKMITNLNPNHKFSFNMVSSCPNGDSTPGAICNALDGVWKNYCDSISISIVK